jgi:hypothetical protein
LSLQGAAASYAAHRPEHRAIVQVPTYYQADRQPGPVWKASDRAFARPGSYQRLREGAKGATILAGVIGPPSL